jgi:hypothetical protein
MDTRIVGGAGEAKRMSVAVAPKRSEWLFAAHADRPAGLHASYILTAGFLGVFWNLVLFVIPFTRGPFTYHPETATARDQFLTTLALVVTSCAISALFRRAIVRARLFLVPIVAAVVMLLGAALFETVWMQLLAIGGDAPWNSATDYLVDLLAAPRYGIWMAVIGYWVTVPMAMLYVIALRAVDRGTLSRHPTV